MARIRTIKPEILEDEKTAALSDSAFRLFTSMIFLADDHGNVRADSRWLQGQIWWAHGEPPRVAEILREVSGAGLIKVYEVRGGIYAHLLGWTKHQRIDNAGKPRVPLPSDQDAKGFDGASLPIVDGSRNSAANHREIPLDPDPDHRTPSIGEPAPAGALQSLKAKVDKAARLPSKGPLPSDWTPSGACRDRARDLRLDLSHESEQFSASARAHGRRYADWDAAFRTWLGNAAKWRDERGGPRFSAQSEIRTNLQPL